jgi:hypothetical protein
VYMELNCARTSFGSVIIKTLSFSNRKLLSSAVLAAVEVLSHIPNQETQKE